MGDICIHQLAKVEISDYLCALRMCLHVRVCVHVCVLNLVYTHALVSMLFLKTNLIISVLLT